MINKFSTTQLHSPITHLLSHFSLLQSYYYRCSPLPKKLTYTCFTLILVQTQESWLMFKYHHLHPPRTPPPWANPILFFLLPRSQSSASALPRPNTSSTCTSSCSLAAAEAVELEGLWDHEVFMVELEGVWDREVLMLELEGVWDREVLKVGLDRRRRNRRRLPPPPQAPFCPWTQPRDPG